MDALQPSLQRRVYVAALLDISEQAKPIIEEATDVSNVGYLNAHVDIKDAEDMAVQLIANCLINHVDPSVGFAGEQSCMEC